MKKKILDLIKDGKISESLNVGEEILSTMKNYYYSWMLLQSRFHDKSEANNKGILSEEKYTLEVNRLNADLLELILKIEESIKSNFHEQEGEVLSLKDKLQNVLIATYEIQDVISEGKSTVTYKAKERFEDDLVAIRVLKNDNLFSGTEAFDEINRVKKLQHRNIITVLGKSPKDTTPKYVMIDYVQGIDVQTLVEESGPRPINETKRILIKICDALYYLHKRKIFNADLRASRILIDGEGEPMISPFIVFRTKSENNYGQIISNLKYMSYQRLNSKDYKHHTPQSNQFSLGVIAYLLLVGEMLFDSESIIDLIESRSEFEKNEKFRVKKLSKIEAPKSIIEMVKRLLSPNRDSRYSSMLEVISTLKSIEIVLDKHQLVAQESYSRACSFNPKIMHSLIEKIYLEDEIDKFDIDSMALKLHNIIGLIIETNAHKSYLTKTMELEIYSNLFFNNFNNFKDILFSLLEEFDYLWDPNIKNCWEQSLNETHQELINNNSANNQ